MVSPTSVFVWTTNTGAEEQTQLERQIETVSSLEKGLHVILMTANKFLNIVFVNFLDNLTPLNSPGPKKEDDGCGN